MIDHSTSSVSPQKVESIINSLIEYIQYITDIRHIQKSIINEMLKVLEDPKFDDDLFIEKAYRWVDSLLEPFSRNSASFVKTTLITFTAPVSLPLNDVLNFTFATMSGFSIIKGIIFFSPKKILDDKMEDSTPTLKDVVKFLKETYPDKSHYIDDIYEKSNMFNYAIKNVLLKIVNSLIEELNKKNQSITQDDIKKRVQQFIDKLDGSKERNTTKVGENASIVFFNTLFGLGNKIENKKGGRSRGRGRGRGRRLRSRRKRQSWRRRR